MKPSWGNGRAYGGDMLELSFNLVGGGKAQVHNNNKKITECQELPQVGGLCSNSCVYKEFRESLGSRGPYPGLL